MAVGLVALLIASLDYSFVQALLFSLSTIPGAFALRRLLPKVSFSNYKNGLLDCTYIVFGIMVGLITIDYYLDYYFRVTEGKAYSFENSIMFNPIFIGVIITAVACLENLLGKYLGIKFPSANKKITFTSNYRKVTLCYSEIAYVESRDKEVIIQTNDGCQYKNFTPISQWENLLGDEFIRIHRSFLVNKSAIKHISPDATSIIICGQELSVSRTYKDKVKEMYRTISNASQNQGESK